jgi:hypothetical protein
MDKSENPLICKRRKVIAGSQECFSTFCENVNEPY